MTWIQTYTGLAFDFADPRPEMVCVEDVAHALSLICRYTGHTRCHYSVAQHCVHMSTLVPPDLAYEALMHDAAEAYVGDISAPLKRMLNAYRQIEAAVDRAVRAAFGLRATIPEAIRIADLQMLMTEAPQLLGPTPKDWGVDAEPYDIEIYTWLPSVAKVNFLGMFDQIAPAAIREAHR